LHFALQHFPTGKKESSSHITALNDGNMVTMLLLLGAVKALLLSANNNQEVFRELLILAEGRSMKTGKLNPSTPFACRLC